MSPEELNSQLISASRGESDLATNHVRELISKGADVHTLDENEETPLMRAAWAGNVESIKLLITAGALLDIHNWEGKTPLMAAVIYRRVAAVKILLDAGANTQLIDDNGFDARRYAQTLGWREIFQLL